MRLHFCRLFTAMILVMGMQSMTAQAAELPPIAPPPSAKTATKTPLISEIRGGFFAHHVYAGFIPSDISRFEFTRWENMNAEILFKPIDWAGEKWLGVLRPHVGGTVNFNNRENMAYVGLSTTKHLFDSPVFFELGFGAAIHDGYLTDPPSGSGLRRLGCRVQFHESFSLGVDITDNMNIMATYEHTSNADLCDFNAGLSNAGIRMGYKF